MAGRASLANLGSNFSVPINLAPPQPNRAQEKSTSPHVIIFNNCVFNYNFRKKVQIITNRSFFKDPVIVT